MLHCFQIGNRTLRARFGCNPPKALIRKEISAFSPIVLFDAAFRSCYFRLRIVYRLCRLVRERYLNTAVFRTFFPLFASKLNVQPGLPNWGALSVVMGATAHFASVLTQEMCSRIGCLVQPM